jgi:hypothetical protein
MSDFASVLPAVAPADPTKHVNYTLGMVLGVDDFTQEFAYLAGRDRWIVRDLLGYGVVSGLRLSIEAGGARGPQLAVDAGVAVARSGQLFCVAPRQCAYLAEWVAAHSRQIDELASPPPDRVRLAVVACYRSCAVDPVPIPGEPCRSEDDLQEPSRLQDSFGLELRLRAPEAPEHEAARDFVDWLRRVPVADGAPDDLEVFLDAIRAAAEETSPPSSPPDFLHGSPPASLALPRARAAEFLQAAFALWATELRERAAGTEPAGDCGCGPPDPALIRGGDCLLLGEVDVFLVPDVLSGALVLDAAREPELVLDRRATLLPLRLLQEWLLAGPPDAGALVASARVRADGTTVAASNASVTKLGDRLFHVGVAGFDPVSHAVSGLALGAVAEAVPHALELVPDDDPGLPALSPPVGPGVVVRLQKVDGSAPTTGFELEVRAR